jgi:hypothetical protein
MIWLLYPMQPRHFTTKTEQGASRAKFCEVPPQMWSKTREWPMNPMTSRSKPR